MASGEDTTPAKSLKTATASGPPPAAAQEPPAAAQEPPAAYPLPDWANYTQPQAFYGGGTTAAAPQFFYPPPVAAASYPWGSQHMMAPYGTPIAYSPMYPHGAVYAHPSMAAGSVYIAAEAERREAEAKKSMDGSGNAKPRDGGKATSGSADEDASQSDSESEGSSEEVREQSTDSQSKKTFSAKFGDGEIMQNAAAMQYNSATAESAYSGRGSPASKLPISAPGRAVSHNPTTDLNAGMKVRPNTVNATPTPAMVGLEGVIWMQDERELRKQKRKMSNRESARRSRQRKQLECEELARRVDELSNENAALRTELDHINKDSQELEQENASLKEELIRVYGSSILTTLEGDAVDRAQQSSAKPNVTNGISLGSNRKS